MPAFPPGFGGGLRGQLTHAEKSFWGGYRIGLTSLDESGDHEVLRQRADLAWASIRAVEHDGRFELGPFPAGLASVDLYMPVELVWRDAGQGDWSRQAIAQVEVVDGVVLARDFVVGELPGKLIVDVRVNGLAEAGLEVQIHRDAGCRATGQTDGEGRFGPFPALPGSLRVQVSGPGWRHVHPVPFVVESGATAHVLVTVELVTARVLFTARASGEPLVRRRIAVVGAGDYALSWSNPTDDAGAATFTLPPGDYYFALNPGAAPGFVIDSSNRSAEVQWTYEGPLVGRVSL